MDSERLPRRLAAIVYADVAGYSRLTGDDEDATHRRLSQYLEFIAARIESNRGRVVHYAGDAVLAMFDAAVDALSSAVSIQNELKLRNSELPDERKLRFRIGVNLGDVIEDRDDIFGDGVNIAARLEGLAQPGGICISESVHSAVGSKLDLVYRDIGEQEVKNISRPVRAYFVVADGESAPSALTKKRKVLLSAVVVLLTLAITTGAAWYLFDRSGQPYSPREAASAESTPADSGQEIPEASIAVLPFTNLNNNPDEDYYIDGITNDIITERNAFFPGAHLTLAAIYGNNGPLEDAEWKASEILALQPDFSLAMTAAQAPYKQKSHLEWYVNGLRKAGLPE